MLLADFIVMTQELEDVKKSMIEAEKQGRRDIEIINDDISESTFDFLRENFLVGLGQDGSRGPRTTIINFTAK